MKRIADNKHDVASEAALLNWKRLGSSTEGKLCSRANKVFSEKKICYCPNMQRKVFESYLQELSEAGNGEVENIIYTLCLRKLEKAGMARRKNVIDFLSSYNYTAIDGIELPYGSDKFWYDFIPCVYQSLMMEGVRNLNGIYYTDERIARKMTAGIFVSKQEKFLDPCCGGGAFLCEVKAEDPSSLFGIDNDPLAVLMTGTNLLCKYSDFDFIPNVFCFDFLETPDMFSESQHAVGVKRMRFDYIYTNPPWGNKACNYSSAFINSKERASLFIEESSKQIKAGGLMNFLLPSSIIKVKTHKDVRQYILSHFDLKKVVCYSDRFKGVFTDFVSMLICNETAKDLCYTVEKENACFDVSMDKKELGEHCAISLSNRTERSILAKVEALRHDDLSHSIWALGIVTGNNKEKVFKTPTADSEPIYTGKDVMPFRLKTPTNHIIYDRTQLQQCAKEEYYRTSEKLIYKFISDKPVFAYDNTQALVLNSANVLIPDISGLSVKSVLGLLNSELYCFVYKVLFKDVKVLKSNLSALAFPLLSISEDESLKKTVDNLIQNKEDKENLNAFVYKKFGISEEQQEYIKTILYG